MLFSDLPKGNKFAHSGVGENNIDLPLHLRDGLVETIKVFQLGNVSLNSRNVRPDCLHGLVEFLLAAARDKDIGTLCDEELCRRQSNPFCAAGDDGGFAFELFGHCLSLRYYRWLLRIRGNISSSKLEQDLTAAIRFQGLHERLLELVERVHMLHCGGERSISYEVSQLLVNFFDLCARRVAYPVDKPESVEAKTTVDELFGRHCRELPTLKGVHDNRAARFKRFGQLAHGSSTHHIKDEAKFLPVESLLNILV